MSDAPANTLTCPDCGDVFPGRGPESARGIRQRVTKHRRKEHGYPSPEELRAMAEANARVMALGDPLSGPNLRRRLTDA